MKIKKSGCLRTALSGFAAILALCITAMCLIMLDNARLPERSQMTDRLSSQEKAFIIEAFHLRQEIGDEVLPGWYQADVPIILYNEEYAFLAGVAHQPVEGWRTIRTGEQSGAAWEMVPDDVIQGEPYYRQKLMPGISPQAFTVKIGDTYAATMTTFEYYPIALRRLIEDDLPGILKTIFPYRLATRLLVNNPDQYVTLILHESAHAYQGISAPDRLKAGEQANHDIEMFYPWQDDRMRVDWQTELDTLANALRAATVQEARLLASEFLQTRQTRRQTAGLSQDLIDYERQREWVEGIGRYAELSAYRLASEDGNYSPAVEMLIYPSFQQYEKYEQRWKREIDQISRTARDDNETRFYYSGMAQAVLLDRLDPDWKARLFEPGVWLEDLLTAALMTEQVNN